MRAEGEGRHRDGRDAAGRAFQVEGGPDLVRLVRAPLLPGREDGGGLGPRPCQVGGDGLGGGVGTEAEFGDHAEVAVARAAQGPEEVLVVGGVRGEFPAVRGDEGGLGEAVAGQAVRAGDDAVAAAEGEAGDADRGAGARGDGDALGGEGAVDVDQFGAGADDRLVREGADAVELRDVDDQAAVAGGPTGVGVAAVADRDGGVAGLRVGEEGADVVRVGRRRRRRRASGCRSGCCRAGGPWTRSGRRGV